MQTRAVVLKGPGQLALESLALTDPGDGELVVEISHSGISTGTEKLLWSGDMPHFPGMGYPLVPGYEAVGEVLEAQAETGFRAGDRVFVPGASCFRDAHGLFGGAANCIVTSASRALHIDPALGGEGALLALAATARHAIAGLNREVPELIVGHGVVGRMLARLTIAAGAPAPTVWDTNPMRRAGAETYPVLAPEDDDRTDYGVIFDATGDSDVLDTLIARLAKGGEVVLAGFYPKGLHFAFPPAFMKEARLRVAAEWTRDDLMATRALIESGALSLEGLVTHTASASDAEDAYRTAFENPECLKMLLSWKEAA